MMISFRQRHRVPKAQDIALVWRALAGVFPNTLFVHGWRESLKGVANYRIQSIVNDKDMFVDVYIGGFYVITVGQLTQVCKSIPSLVGNLGRMLGVNLGG